MLLCHRHLLNSWLLHVLLSPKTQHELGEGRDIILMFGLTRPMLSKQKLGSMNMVSDQTFSMIIT